MPITLSADTLTILKNFADINPNILFKPGKTISTVAQASKAMFAQAEVAEVFSVQAGIYDLRRLLGVLSLFQAPALDFTEKCLLIREGSKELRYFYADPSLLVVPPGTVRMPDAPIQMTWTAADLKQLLDASGVMSLPDIQIENTDKPDEVLVRVLDLGKLNADNQSDQFVLTVKLTKPAPEKAQFKLRLKTANLVMLPGDYKLDLVKVGAAGISRFA